MGPRYVFAVLGISTGETTFFFENDDGFVCEASGGFASGGLAKGDFSLWEGGLAKGGFGAGVPGLD